MLFPAPRKKPGWVLWFLVALVVATTLFPLWLLVKDVWGVATLTYEITPGAVLIEFGPRTTRIERGEIIDATIIEEPSRGRRLFGTSFPGLKEGRWSFAETGPIRLVSTTTRPLTVIETAQGKWGISPADPERFIDTLNAGGAGRFEPVESQAFWGLVALSLVPLLSCGVMAGVIRYVVGLYRNIGYELTDEGVLIHGARRPKLVPYAKIDDVKEASPAGTPWRTFGVGMPGMYWGAFSWKEAGRHVNLYATRLRPIVLIQAGSRTYGITPEESDRFLAELRARLDKRRA